MITVYGTPGTGPSGGRSQVEMGDDAGIRVQWVSNEFEARGKRFSVTDGYRPTGIESDYWVDDESKTSTGGFNQWYAIGQHKRRNAAYAAPAGQSDHSKTWYGAGAIDCDVDDMALRHLLMGCVGMIQTDSTESWHFAIRSEPASRWDRTKVKAPIEKAPKPTPSVVKNPNRLKEAITMYLVQQSDGEKRVFIMLQTGALHLTSQKQVNSYIEHFTGLGLTGPGYSIPLSRSSESITLISMANEAQANKVLTMPKK